jgi:hypothetical protein
MVASLVRSMREGNIMSMDTNLAEVTGVRVLGHYRLRLTFSDGKRGDVDLSDLRGKPNMFAALADPAYFRLARVDRELGTVTWPNGLDLAPEVLYEEAVPPSSPSGPDWHAVGAAAVELLGQILRALRDTVGALRDDVAARSSRRSRSSTHIGF